MIFIEGHLLRSRHRETRTTGCGLYREGNVDGYRLLIQSRFGPLGSQGWLGTSPILPLFRTGTGGERKKVLFMPSTV